MHPAVLKTISDKPEYKNYFDQCEEELSRAKSTKLKCSWVTFYNLLMDRRKKLKNYAANADLIEDIEKGDCNEKFPIYGASMKENMKKAVKRRELYDKSCKFLLECLPLLNSCHLIIRDVIDCVMSEKDLLNFCEPELFLDRKRTADAVIDDRPHDVQTF